MGIEGHVVYINAQNSIQPRVSSMITTPTLEKGLKVFKACTCGEVYKYLTLITYHFTFKP